MRMTIFNSKLLVVGMLAIGLSTLSERSAHAFSNAVSTSEAALNQSDFDAQMLAQFPRGGSFPMRNDPFSDRLRNGRNSRDEWEDRREDFEDEREDRREDFRDELEDCRDEDGDDRRECLEDLSDDFEDSSVRESSPFGDRSSRGGAFLFRKESPKPSL